MISWTKASNCFVEDGNLILRNKREDYTPNGRELRHWTGAEVTSPRKFKYGYIEGRIKVPSQQSYQEFYGYAFGQVQKRDADWLAFWLQSPSSYSPNFYQEIDIFEFFGTSREFQFAVYKGDADHEGIIKDTHTPYTHVDASTNFHKYAILWTPVLTSIYFDDVLVGSLPTEQNQNAMSIILDNKMADDQSRGHVNSDTPDPGHMLVDYIRVYQKEGSIAFVEGPNSQYTNSVGTKICRGQQATFYAPDFPNTSVHFTSSSGLTVLGEYGYGSYTDARGTTKSCIVTANQAGAQTLTVSITFSDGHVETSAPYNVEVLENTLPTPTPISVQKLICNDYSLSIPSIAGADSYVWTIDGGFPYSFGGSTNEYLRAPFHGTVSVVASNSCGSSLSGSQYFDLYEDPNCTQILSVRHNGISMANVEAKTPIKESLVDSDALSVQTILKKNEYTIHTLDSDTKTTVYPIPFSDNLNIQLSGNFDENHKIDIVNVLGQVVKSVDFEQNKIVINCSDLVSGIYIVKIIGLKSKRIETFNVSKM